MSRRNPIEGAMAMTNMDVAKQFEIVSDFRAGHYLGLDPEVWETRPAPHGSSPCMRRSPLKSREAVLAAVPPDHFVNGWTIKRRLCLTTSQVSAELWALTQQGKLERQRHEGRWAYRRIA